MKRETLHTAMERNLGPMNAAFEKVFPMSSRNKKWKCHPVVISYCFDNPESNNMSGVNNGRA